MPCGEGDLGEPRRLIRPHSMERRAPRARGCDVSWSRYGSGRLVERIWSDLERPRSDGGSCKTKILGGNSQSRWPAARDVNAKSDDFRTPRIVAAGPPGGAAIVKLLLAHGTTRRDPGKRDISYFASGGRFYFALTFFEFFEWRLTPNPQKPKMPSSS